MDIRFIVGGYQLRFDIFLGKNRGFRMDDEESDCVFEQLGRCDAQYFFRDIVL